MTKKKKAAIKKISEAEAIKLIYTSSLAVTRLSQKGSKGINARLKELLIDTLIKFQKEKLLRKKMKRAFNRVGKGKRPKIGRQVKGKGILPKKDLNTQPAHLRQGEDTVLESVYKVKGNTRRTGGIQEIRAYRLSDGSLEFEIAGSIEESISAIRRSNTKELTGNSSLDYSRKLSRGKEVYYGNHQLNDYDRAHMWGHGFGDEAMDGITYVHKDLNRELQNKILEFGIREKAEIARRKGGKLIVSTSARTYPPLTNKNGKRSLNRSKGEHLLQSITYRVELELPNGQRKLVGAYGFSVDPPPPKFRIKKDKVGNPIIDKKTGEPQKELLFNREVDEIGTAFDDPFFKN